MYLKCSDTWMFCSRFVRTHVSVTRAVEYTGIFWNCCSGSEADSRRTVDGEIILGHSHGWPFPTNFACLLPSLNGWNTGFLVGNPIFRCYVSFRDGIWWCSLIFRLCSGSWKVRPFHGPGGVFCQFCAVFFVCSYLLMSYLLEWTSSRAWMGDVIGPI